MTLPPSTHQYGPVAQNLPKYLAKTGYKEPTASETNNHSDSDPDGLTFFGRLQKTPKSFADFTGHMEAWTAWKTPWTKIYNPIKLLTGARSLEKGSPLVVDVGGNTGTDISHVLGALPADQIPPGALVLQDLAEMIEKARAALDPKSKPMAHDFFKPQPAETRGARAYFLHAVLHDWPEAEAIRILGHLREAMVAGYSKLFVYEVVVPATGASISQTTMDVNMLALLSAAERTRSQWEVLLGAAGFRIVKFWPDPQQYEMLIEAEVAGG